MIETKLSQAVVAAVKSLYGLEVEESAVQLQKTRSEFEGEEYAQKRLQLNRDLEREISEKLPYLESREIKCMPQFRYWRLHRHPQYRYPI